MTSLASALCVDDGQRIEGGSEQRGQRKIDRLAVSLRAQPELNPDPSFDRHVNKSR